MVNIWPLALAMYLAIALAIRSVGPPAEYGTTIRTGLVGKSCAVDANGKAVTDKARQTAAMRPQRPGKFEPNKEFILSFSCGWNEAAHALAETSVAHR
jgi:hypothetical protein